MELKDLPQNLRAQAEKKLAAQGKQPAKESKYHNVKTEVGTGDSSIKFDSKKEANRYKYLMELQDAGTIKNLKLQHHFQLQGTFKTAEGETVRGIEYVADFTYMVGGMLIIEDVKSEITRKNPVYIMKKKMMAEKGLTITEV